MSQYQDENELGEFRRLKAEGAPRDPSLSPFARSAFEQHKDQHQQDNGVGRISKPCKMMVVRCPHDEEGRRAETDPYQLLEMIRRRPPLLSMRDAINGQHADPQDG